MRPSPRRRSFARAFDRRAVIKLKGSPVAGVVREVLESAVKMARLAMRSLDVSAEEIDRAEDMYRARDRERLKMQNETGDLRAARDRHDHPGPARAPARAAEDEAGADGEEPLRLRSSGSALRRGMADGVGGARTASGSGAASPGWRCLP